MNDDTERRCADTVFWGEEANFARGDTDRVQVSFAHQLTAGYEL